MAKWAHADVLDNGPARIKSDANKMYLLSTYAAADSFATVTANKLCEATMTSGDYTLGSASSNRILTTATKTANATASAGGTPDLHVAWVDTVNSKVLWVTDETTNQPITSGNPIDFPAFVYTSNQPT